MESKAACQNLLAVDLGAESGRLIAGSFDGNTLGIEVLHRFPNRPVRLLDRLHWDLLDLHREILNGLRLAGQKLGQITSVGVDTWGVDFAFLGKDGGLLGNPRHYRDPHTESIMESVFQVVSKRELYSRTGIQFMRFNSLFQLAALSTPHQRLKSFPLCVPMGGVPRFIGMHLKRPAYHLAGIG